MSFRIGHGYDVHKLIKDRDFILCGVKIDYDKGLLGHSDADVGLHAIMDSLLGAAALGDIGSHFPDKDNKYKNIDSKILLKKVFDIIKNKNFEIQNIDVTIILEKPKINKYIFEMRKIISEILEIKLDQINIKATTEEGLNFTGEGLGVAAHSVSLLSQIS
ncbi:MAG: 2-C-methyl-D-erythritol 2,4-cyclodiphosphate synthase [Oscillospiraceae bacterium]|nr:2-C-methyl-D-erythritol 2,4-cyclodiphosphate synthase [Oscillospiraceae bacterium]